MIVFTPNTVIKSADVNFNFDELNTDITNLGGAWQTWTPSIRTNLTVGNGTEISKYRQIGKTVYGYYFFKLGSTSAVTGSLTIGVPVTGSSIYTTSGSLPPVGNCRIQDAGTANYYGPTIMDSTTGIRPHYLTGAGINLAGNTNTTPMTWTTNDSFEMTFLYEAA